jgi:hypothetical protein
VDQLDVVTGEKYPDMNKKFHEIWPFVIILQVPKYSTNLTHFMNSNVHDRVHKSPPLVSILSQIYTVHAFIFSVNNIYFNIIILPTSRYSRVLPTNSLRISLLLKHAACHIPCPSHYVLCSTNHEAPHRTIWSNPCYVLLITNIPYMDIGVNE